MELHHKFSDKENKKVEEFVLKHYPCRDEHEEACKTCAIQSMMISYILCPNSVGTALSVRCEWCKEEENITDYSIW